MKERQRYINDRETEFCFNLIKAKSRERLEADCLSLRVEYEKEVAREEEELRRVQEEVRLVYNYMLKLK